MPAVIGRAPNPWDKASNAVIREKKPRPRPKLDSRTLTLLAWTRANHDQASAWIYALRRAWATYKAVRIGNQYVEWSDKQHALIQNVRTPRHRVRASFNVVHQVVQNFIAQLLKNFPRFTVAPASAEDKDRQAARVAEKILDYHWHSNSMVRKQQTIASWMFETGACFASTEWDPDGGPLVDAVDDDGEPLIDPDTGQPMVDKNGDPMRFQLGDVSIEVVPPYQVIPDLQALSFDDMNHVSVQKMRPLPWIREKYPKWGKYIQPESSRGIGSLEWQFSRLTAANREASFAAGMGRTEWARVITTYFRPGVNIPGVGVLEQGGVAVQCQGLGEFKENLYMKAPGITPNKDWHPLTMFSCYDAGRFWPYGVVENLWPIQREINRTYSSIIEAARMTGRPKVLIPKLSGISDQQFNSEAGEKIKYNQSGGKPEYISPPTIPAYIFGLLKGLYDNVDFVSGQHGPTRGQAPSAIKSGIGLSLLQEQDATDMGPIMQLWESSLQALGRNVLLRTAQFWEVERTISVVGADLSYEVHTFSKADIGSNVDVRVQAGSGLPRSKAASEARVEKLIQNGILMPTVPAHRKVIMQLLEMGIEDDIFTSDQRDSRRAKQENELLLRGVPAATYWYYDHQIHLQEHVEFMKSDAYLDAVSRNPAVGAAFNLHLVGHANPQFPMPAGAMNPMDPRALGEPGADESNAGVQDQAPQMQQSMSLGKLGGPQGGLQGLGQNYAQTIGAAGNGIA